MPMGQTMKVCELSSPCHVKAFQQSCLGQQDDLRLQCSRVQLSAQQSMSAWISRCGMHKAGLDGQRTHAGQC